MTLRYGCVHSDDLIGPECFVSIADPGESQGSNNVPAILDTGSDITVIPICFARHLTFEMEDIISIISFTGDEYKPRVMLVDIYIEKLRKKYPEVKACIVEDSDVCNYIIIGRDILNQSKVVLDAPRQEWRIDCHGCSECHDGAGI